MEMGEIMSKQTNPFGADFTKLFADFKVPGLDTEAMLALHRKNMEALTSANQAAVDGVQAVLRRQTDLIRQSMEEVSKSLRDAMNQGAPEEKLAKQAEQAKHIFESSIANLREMSDMLSKSNQEAADIIAKRISTALEDLKNGLAKMK